MNDKILVVPECPPLSIEVSSDHVGNCVKINCSLADNHRHLDLLADSCYALPNMQFVFPTTSHTEEVEPTEIFYFEFSNSI